MARHGWRKAFLAGLASTGTVTSAAAAARVCRSHVYRVASKDPKFQAAWNDAIEQGADELERVCRERAIAGSDLLLIFMLKALRPEKFHREIFTPPPERQPAISGYEVVFKEQTVEAQLPPALATKLAILKHLGGPEWQQVLERFGVPQADTGSQPVTPESARGS